MSACAFLGGVLERWGLMATLPQAVCAHSMSVSYVCECVCVCVACSGAKILLWACSTKEAKEGAGSMSEGLTRI